MGLYSRTTRSKITPFSLFDNASNNSTSTELSESSPRIIKEGKQETTPPTSPLPSESDLNKKQ